MLLRNALTQAVVQLAPVSDTPRLDAELLMAHALGVGRDALLLKHLDDDVPPGFWTLVERRAGAEPVAYITGRRDFWTLSLQVTPDVLIPRPDSETLIEAAIDHFGDQGPGKVIDLGTGSGALLLAALDQWPDAWGIGVDRSAAAVAVARENAVRNGILARAAFIVGDWAMAVGTRFDLVLCNPPYVESGASLPPDVAGHEPASALYAGTDGMDDYRRIIPMLPALVADGGIGCIEIGATQADAVAGLALAHGLKAQVARDLAGRDRCVIVRKT